jgi:hypothetical protein
MNAVIEGVLAGAFPTRNPNAQVFNVDSYAELTAAITAAVAGNGDIILIKRGGIEVTATVAFNKSGLQVYAVDDGQSPLARGEFNALYAAAAFTDGPVATITAPTSFRGIGFASRDTGATFFSGAAALIGGAAPAGAFGVWMKNCRFPKWNLDNRIGLAIAGGAAVSEVLVEDCTFEGVGASFASGIYVQGAVQNLHVRNNYFRQCTYAITHGAFAGGGPHCMYERNFLEDAKMLDSGGNAATGLICDNFMETATDATSYDDTVATLQGQGLNFSGNHYSE